MVATSTKDRVFQVDDGSTRLFCNIDTLVDTRLLIQSNSGGGKSWVVRRILEQTHGRVQQIVLDPEGEFSSLRKRFDYVHAAPVGGDCAVHPRSAALLAQRLLKLGVSAILDLYELKAHDRIRFVRFFLEALINSPKTLWHPVLVVIDEAHVFCPQTGTAESTQDVIDLCSRGRKRGFAAVLATQRIQKLHKDAAAECNNKLIGRTTLDVDIARAADELGLTKARWHDLKELPPGHFFASGPAFSERGVNYVHVGNVQTPHPKAGARIAYAAPPPTSAIRALLPQLADLPAEAEKQEQTTHDLQQLVSRLQRDLAAAPTKTVEKIVEVQVIPPAVREQILGLLKSAEGLAKQIMANPPVRPPAVVEPKTKAPTPSVKRAVVPGTAKLAKAERAILTVLAQSPHGSSKTRTALLAGYSSTGGGFNNALSALRTGGLIEPGSDPLRISEEGTRALGSVEPLPTDDQLRDYWIAKAGGKAERAILTVIFEAWPRSLSKEDVATQAGYAPDGGGFNNALSRLRTMELIHGRGELKAADSLFDE